MEVELNGARIHYKRSGAGYPVVFLHAGVADEKVTEALLDAGGAF